MLRPAASLSLSICLALLSGAAGADAEAQMRRALIERQQRTDELILRLQQSRPVSGNLRAQQELDALHLRQQLQLHIHNTRQLRQFDAARQAAPADPISARMLMQHQQQMFERDRQLELQRFRWDEEQLIEREQQRSTQEAPQ